MNRLATRESFEAHFTATEFLHMAETGAFDDMTMELVAGRLERQHPPRTDHALRQATAASWASWDSIWPTT